MIFVYFRPCCLRLACWQCVRTGISSWPKTSKKLTRLSSKRTSRSMSSTSRKRMLLEAEILNKMPRHTFLLSIYVCVTIYSVSYEHLWSPTLALILELIPPTATRGPTTDQTRLLMEHTLLCEGVLFVQALYWLLTISGPDCSKDRMFLSMCTHLKRHDKKIY